MLTEVEDRASAAYSDVFILVETDSYVFAYEFLRYS